MANDTPMEPRVAALEDGFKGLAKDVSGLKETLNAALLGTLDGKPGIVQTLNNSLEASKTNATKLDAITAEQRKQGEQLDGLRLDRAQIKGIVITVSALWAALATIVALTVKLWK